MLKTFFCQDLQIELMGKCTVLMVAKHLTIRVISVCAWRVGMEWDCGPSWFREHLDASGLMRADLHHFYSPCPSAPKSCWMFALLVSHHQ